VKTEVSLLSTLEGRAVGEINVQIPESVMQIDGVMIIPVKLQNEMMTDLSVNCRREKVFHRVQDGEASEAIIAPAGIGQDHRNTRSVVEGSVLIEKEVVVIADISTVDDRVLNAVVPIVSIKIVTANPMVDDPEVAVIPLIVLTQREGTDAEGGGETRGRNVRLSVFTVLGTKLSLSTEVGAGALCGLMRR